MWTNEVVAFLLLSGFFDFKYLLHRFRLLSGISCHFRFSYGIELWFWRLGDYSGNVVCVFFRLSFIIVWLLKLICIKWFAINSLVLNIGSNRGFAPLLPMRTSHHTIFLIISLRLWPTNKQQKSSPSKTKKSNNFFSLSTNWKII